MLWKTWDFAHLCSGQFCTVSLEFVLPESSADSSCHSTWSSLFLWYCCLPAPNCNFTNQRRWDCWSKDMLGLLRWRLIKSNSAARSDKAFVAGCQFLLIFGIFQIPYFPEWKNSKDSNKNKKNSSFNRNRLQSSSVWVPHWLVFTNLPVAFSGSDLSTPGQKVKHTEEIKKNSNMFLHRLEFPELQSFKDVYNSALEVLDPMEGSDVNEQEKLQMYSSFWSPYRYGYHIIWHISNSFESVVGKI